MQIYKIKIKHYFSMNKFVKQKQFNEKLRLQAQMKDKKARLELEEKNKDLIETQKAAEAAISSPLLEDVNLAGARGILVNITASEDMTIEEFEEVGEIVRGFAADDATTIVGTCTDPEMTESIRVTIVATGLGSITRPSAIDAPDLQAVPKAGFTTDYHDLDKPAVTRYGQDVDLSRNIDMKDYAEPAPEENTVNSELIEKNSDDQMDILDIPAFLRRQAD